MLLSTGAMSAASRSKRRAAAMIVSVVIAIAAGFGVAAWAKVKIKKENVNPKASYAQYLVSDLNSGDCVQVNSTICIECQAGRPPAGVTGVLLVDGNCMFQIQGPNSSCLPCPGGDGAFYVP